jgi:hypothetical protein
MPASRTIDNVCQRSSQVCEVVVVAVHAHRGEFVDLLGTQHSQRAGDVDVDLVANRFDSGRDLRHQPLVGSAYRGHDAELAGTRLGRLLGRLDQAGDVQPGAAHRRGEQPRLGAEMAVLRAAAGFQADDALDLDLGAAPAHPDLVRQRKQFLEMVVRQLQHLQHLVLAQSLTTLQHLQPSLRQNVSHAITGWPGRRLSHSVLS